MSKPSATQVSSSFFNFNTQKRMTRSRLHDLFLTAAALPALYLLAVVKHKSNRDENCGFLDIPNAQTLSLNSPKSASNLSRDLEKTTDLSTKKFICCYKNPSNPNAIGRPFPVTDHITKYYSQYSGINNILMRMKQR